jgi:hypothetical protein
VFDVFCHPPELHEFDGTESREAPGVFCESVIFYALYNFYRANGPRLIHLDRDLDSESKNLIVTGIRLTDRGREVYGSLSRKFYYLQLVPDDSHLILPADLVSANSAIEYDDGYDTTIGRDKITEFSFLKSRNYSYLVANPVVYRNRVGEVISHKARKLAKFLGILDAARSAEQFRYWATFARLEKDGALIPTARQLLEGVCKEINVLRRVVDGVEVSDDVLLSDFQRYSSKYTDTMYTAYGTIPKGK